MRSAVYSLYNRKYVTFENIGSNTATSAATSGRSNDEAGVPLIQASTQVHNVDSNGEEVLSPFTSVSAPTLQRIRNPQPGEDSPYRA